VSQEEDTDRHALLHFEVQDTGIGISEQAQTNLFGAFIQADGSTTRKYGGTGLGLAISKQLVELMGGEIGVESRQGGGTTFWFNARFGKTDQHPATVRQHSKLRGLRALIVDDNATNRRILEHFLGNWGIWYESAKDGFKAQEILQQASQLRQPFQIGVLDMQMPGMDGLELARLIKSDPTNASMAIVMLTSLGQSPMGWRDAGIDTCLNKPARQSQLYNAIAMLIHQHRAKEESAPSPLTASPSSTTTPQVELAGRILIAEDNIVNQRVAQGLLKKLGGDFKIDIVKNGLEVLEAYQHQRYDLILMDVQMPEMDGYEATRRIREIEQEQNRMHLPIIAMTANAMKGDREDCLLAGMDDYLPKPVKREVLRETLSGWLSQKPDYSIDKHPPAPDPLSERSHQPIDGHTIRELRDLMGEEFDDLINAYLDDTPLLLSKAKVAIESQVPEELRISAHSLKSSSANIGALRLAEFAKQLEVMGRQQNLTQALLLWKRSKSEYNLVKLTLNTLRRAKAS
jgi:CheY-like chemotaxis protein/HPt (histidine-containing phosphotransfer) domain-containing protein